MKIASKLVKMIRHIISLILTFIVHIIIFLFKKINYLFKLFNNKFKSINLKFKKFYSNFKHVIKEGLLALIICAIGDLIAGIILGNMTFFLETFPGLLIIIPGAIGMRGNIFGSLSSRLNSNLHIGTLSPEFKKSKMLNANIFSSIVLTLILSLFLAIFAVIISFVLNFETISFVDLSLISIFSGMVSCIIMLPITMFISLKSFENGWDPDNITTPLIAACGDLFTLPSLILSIIIVYLLNNESLKIAILIILILFTIFAFIYGILSKGETKKILSQSAPVLFLCSFIGIFAGGFLNNSSATLLKNPTLLTLVPLFSGENGSLLSILSARLSSALHSGIIEPVLKPDKNTLYNFAVICIFGLFIYPFIGILAEISSYILGETGIGIISILAIMLISGFIVISIMIIVIFYISSISFRKGLDPDNIVIPISTSFTDLISTVIMISISLIILF